MSEVTVRQYNSEDFKGLIRLLGEVYDSHVSQEVLEKNYLGDNKMIFVAENEGNIIGCSFLEICRDYIREYTYGYVTTEKKPMPSMMLLDSRSRRPLCSSKNCIKT